VNIIEIFCRLNVIFRYFHVFILLLTFPLVIAFFIIRFEESGKVCSGEYSWRYDSLDFDEKLLSFYEDSFEIDKGKVLYYMSFIISFLLLYICYECKV